ncbi:MAG: hypothetical protein IKW89_03495 [Bacteroidales bacterium]|nr:hypothetical protein [Bacteroidales bacterium]
MRHLIIIPSLLILSFCANAQTAAEKRSNLSDDIGFYAGVYTPMYKGQESDVLFGVSYGHFYSTGIGYRTGFQLASRVAEVDNAFGIPIAFAYRTPARNTDGRVRSGAIAAGETFGYEAIMGYSNPLRGALAAFIANLFSQAEFFTGVTPGYVSGESSPVSTASWGPGYLNTDRTWTERNGRFSLTLDAGTCLNYRLWRFDLKLSPAIHYNLTRNYIVNTESVRFENGSDIGTKTSLKQPLRWFFSFTGGLSFKF